MKNKKIDEIESLLTTLLHTLGELEYLNMIKENNSLKKYDYFAAKIDNGEYPENYLNKIDDYEFDEILYYLKEKMTMH